MSDKCSVLISQTVVLFFLEEAVKETVGRTARSNIKWSLEDQEGKHRINPQKWSKIVK